MGGRPHTRRDRCSERAGLLRACEGGRGVRCSHLPSRSRPPRPRRQHEDEVDPAGLEVRGQGEGPDPADHCTWPCARLCWPERRRWVLRARVTQQSGSAGARLEAARSRTLDSPGATKRTRLLAARQHLSPLRCSLTGAAVWPVATKRRLRCLQREARRRAFCTHCGSHGSAANGKRAVKGAAHPQLGQLKPKTVRGARHRYFVVVLRVFSAFFCLTTG